MGIVSGGWQLQEEPVPFELKESMPLKLAPRVAVVGDITVAVNVTDLPAPDGF